MVRKLKTYLTSLGFFEQAIAAPSMKAALEAWGADSNLFHQGAAKESTDPDIVAATMEKPGVVLKRPVGSDGPFGEHAELPKNLGDGGRTKRRAAPPARKEKKPSGKPDNPAERKAAQAYERERQRREREETKEEAARQKERERKQRAVDKAQAALDEAEREHTKREADLRAELEVIEDRIRSENDDWNEEEKQLKAAIRHARNEGLDR
jgi:hypothetical protein